MNLHYLLLEVRIRDNVKMHNYLQLSIILHGGEFNPCIIMAHKAILVGHKIFEIQGSYHIYIFICICISAKDFQSTNFHRKCLYKSLRSSIYFYPLSFFSKKRSQRLFFSCHVRKFTFLSNLLFVSLKGD